VNPVLTFVAPPPGLAPLVDFSLDKIDGADGLYAMHALHADLDSELRLFLLDAQVHLPDYAPMLTDEQCAAVDVTTPEDAIVLVVANPAADGTTVNLLAPIVVNASTGASAQFILEGQNYSLRQELRSAA
jgi:flagellar assembly factor FliW